MTAPSPRVPRTAGAFAAIPAPRDTLGARVTRALVALRIRWAARVGWGPRATPALDLGRCRCAEPAPISHHAGDGSVTWCCVACDRPYTPRGAA